MVIRRHPESGDRRLDLLQWGLLPGWTKDLKAARKPINARSETAASSGMFKGALAARRCLVPADAFYEWRALPDGKQPYAIARQDGTPLAFAGLWEGWRAPGGEVVRTFAILTTAANDTMRPLHERMPVIMEPVDWPVWLGETGGEPPALMRPAAEGVLQLWPVSRAVNSVRNNGPDLLDRIDDPAAPPPSDAPAGANPA
jgi:putative SOS response-associated peptidase YedK